MNIVQVLRGHGVGVGKKSTGNAVAADLLSGKTATTAAGDVTGTMVDRSLADVSANSFDGTLVNGYIHIKPKTGYYDQASANSLTIFSSFFTTSNIKAGSTVFGKTGTFTSDATVAAGDMKNGITGYNNGSKITGTMPIRSGDTAALASSVSGTTLKLRASDGYRDGVSDYVTITDADFISSNIRNGTDVLGITGSLVPGAPNAKGVIASNSSGIVTVSGLAFAPKVIVIYKDGTSGTSPLGIYTAAGHMTSSATSLTYDNGSLYTNKFTSVTGSGFTWDCTIAAAFNFQWIAYG